MQIAKKVQFVERAKIALLDQLADVFRAIQSGNERELSEVLGQLVAMTYALGHHLDVPLAEIDKVAESGLPSSLAQDWAASEDLEPVLRHLKMKR
jgi:hypothetical protein